MSKVSLAMTTESTPHTDFQSCGKRLEGVLLLRPYDASRGRLYVVWKDQKKKQAPLQEVFEKWRQKVYFMND